MYHKKNITVVVSHENALIKIDCSKILSLAEIFCSIESEIKDFQGLGSFSSIFKCLKLPVLKTKDFEE